MQGWIPDLSRSTGPKYLAIAEALSRDVAAGVLAGGDRLPPQRVLADALGIDLTTVTRAYGEARRAGLIEGDGRRGSFVKAGRHDGRRRAEALPPLPTPEPGMNSPPEHFGGSLIAEWRKSLAYLLDGADTATGTAARLGYQISAGAHEVRRSGQYLLARRGIACDEETLLVSAGGQHALHAIFSSELAPGDVLAVCPFVYPGILALARRFDVTLRVIAADEEGMLPDALAVACAEDRIKAVYLVPGNDNPTTASMGQARRERIAHVIAEHGLMLIEDDAYGFLAEGPPPAIAALLPDQTWYVASVSKVLAPALRVAWLRAPDVAKAWRLAADMHDTAIMAPSLNAALVSDWVATGTFDRLVAELRGEAARRVQIVAQCLPAGSFAADPAGYHLWLPLPADADTRQLCDALVRHGMVAVPADAFRAERDVAMQALRISIGGILPDERLRRGLLLLATLLIEGTQRKISLV